MGTFILIMMFLGLLLVGLIGTTVVLCLISNTVWQEVKKELCGIK